MTPKLPPAQPRTLLWALGVVCVALLGACGPGVGGSGTGAEPDSLEAFGATAAPVCDSTLAPQLVSCAAAVPAATLFADSSATPRVTARLEGNTVDLQAPCAGLQFKGVWGVAGKQPARFYGQATLANSSVLASLTATSTTAGGLLVDLRDAQGGQLLGPLTLLPAPPGTAAPSCR